MKVGAFSVLCSLYFKEKPEYLNQAFESLLWQTLEPSEIVVVHDGPLTQDLYETLDNWREKLPIVDVILPKNVGLGEALNKGLAHCNFELIGRIDTDDINHIDRFQKQVTFMNDNPGISASSTYINEFESDPNHPSRIRRVPSNEKIKSYSLKRNPLNHMSTMFRKSAIVDCGGYKHLLYMEDYYLWLRLQAFGYNIGNLEEVLVSARVGNGMLERRRGRTYAISEIKLMCAMYKLRLTKSPTIAFYFILRSSLRLLPSRYLSLVYRFIRR